MLASSGMVTFFTGNNQVPKEPPSSNESRTVSAPISMPPLGDRHLAMNSSRWPCICTQQTTTNMNDRRRPNRGVARTAFPPRRLDGELRKGVGFYRAKEKGLKVERFLSPSCVSMFHHPSSIEFEKPQSPT
ncbi:hypothetical protein V2G26_015259 [Clonostachys chloroleuca]